jgi:hypothetical protein
LPQGCLDVQDIASSIPTNAPAFAALVLASSAGILGTPSNRNISTSSVPQIYPRKTARCHIINGKNVQKAQAIQVYRSYRIKNKVKLTCWYKNGSFDTFRLFCNQNRDKPISVKLTNRSEPINGAIYSDCLNSSEKEGLFLLLTDRVTHPAYYGLDAIESVHIGIGDAFSSWADNGHLSDRITSGIITSGIISSGHLDLRFA